MFIYNNLTLRLTSEMISMIHRAWWSAGLTPCLIMPPRLVRIFLEPRICRWDKRDIFKMEISETKKLINFATVFYDGKFDWLMKIKSPPGRWKYCSLVLSRITWNISRSESEHVLLINVGDLWNMNFAFWEKHELCSIRSNL